MDLDFEYLGVREYVGWGAFAPAPHSLYGLQMDILIRTQITSRVVGRASVPSGRPSQNLVAGLPRIRVLLFNGVWRRGRIGVLLVVVLLLLLRLLLPLLRVGLFMLLPLLLLLRGDGGRRLLVQSIGGQARGSSLK